MRRLLILPIALAAALAGAATSFVQDQCGPFTDVSPAFCPSVFQMYVLGITAGTSSTTYSPDATWTRDQAAVFASKGVNQAIARSNRRAALGQWWTMAESNLLARTDVGPSPVGVVSDGIDLWVANHFGSGQADVSRVRASDGRLLETWGGAAGAWAITTGMGLIVATSQRGFNNPHLVYAIDPRNPSLQATAVANLPSDGLGIVFDGARFWVTSVNSSISIVTPRQDDAWEVVTIPGFGQLHGGMVFDGRNVWVIEGGFPGTLLKLDGAGAVIQRVTVGGAPLFPAFDGESIWVPNFLDNTISVVRASTGREIALLETDLNPFAAAFDGERMAILGLSLTIWRAADLRRLRSIPMGPSQTRICSGGQDFWITFDTTNQLGRF